MVNLKLGKLVYKEFGLRKFNENLNIGLSLPTDYDDELKRLSIEKPMQATADNQSGWLFTFILPLWLTITLAVLIIYYIISVIKALIRNSSERFSGTVDISDSRGRSILVTYVKIKPSGILYIGEGGNSGCDLAGAGWKIKIDKNKPSALLFWQRPSFRWSEQIGYVRYNNNKKRGFLGRYGKNNTKKSVSIECGPDSEHITHSVSIRIK